MSGQFRNVEKVVCSILLILLLYVPTYHGTQISDYDLLVANGNHLTFLKSCSNETLNMQVAELTRSNKIRIFSVVPDVNSNKIYFSMRTKTNSSISIFHPDLNRTVEILSSSRSSIGSLVLYEDYLYWSNETGRSIMRLNIADEFDVQTESLPSTPELVFTDANATFESFVVHPITGKIFYTMWRKSNDSKILSYDPKSGSIETLVENVFQPKGLYIDNNNENLYWIDNPPGIYFDIERVSLKQKGERQLVIKEQNQHPFALVTRCSKIYWTDMMNKGVWGMEMTNKKMSLIKYFSPLIPYGISLVKMPTESECQKEVENVQVSKVNVTSTSSSSGHTVEKCTGNECLQGTNIPTISGNPPQRTDADTNKGNRVNAFNEKQSTLLFCNQDQDNKCLNGATCIVLWEQVHCICPPGLKGSKCEEKSEPQVEARPEATSSSNSTLLIVTGILGAVIIVLLAIIAVLTRKVRKQSSLPKIRRRVVVSHRSDIDPPGSGSVCEMIDIENCCNMNICETPCYERLGSFSGGSSSSSGPISGRIRRTSVKEDKKCLLSA